MNEMAKRAAATDLLVAVDAWGEAQEAFEAGEISYAELAEATDRVARERDALGLKELRIQRVA